MDSKQKMEWVLRSMKIPYVKEFPGIPGRRFRFDFAIPSQMIAIEYEGLTNGSTKTAGHQTREGYTKDARKYNLAVLNGWKVLRYTWINQHELEEDLKILIAGSASLQSRSLQVS